MKDYQTYDNPLIQRYASRKMAHLWSPQVKFSTWRRLWVALAEAERELGLNIAAEQVEALKAQVEAIDFAAAEEYERRFRHDVMAHVHAYGDALARFADRWKDLPCLGYTHFQPAQLVTVGKRATLWCYELILDLGEIERRLADIRFLGVKGTTGTQASFLALFDGDHDKVKALDEKVAAAFGFDKLYPVAGQTYSQKVDSQTIAALAAVAESAHRFGMDLRLLAHEQEVEEPFEAEQIGSSAMAYKRNPMRAERMCSLARFVMGLPAGMANTAGTQWLERTLDDSAIRRLLIPQAFLGVDAILNLYNNVVPGLVVHPPRIAAHIAEQLPFMATENLLMAAVRAGGDRQALHERIRVHSLDAAARLKGGAGDNDLIARLEKDDAFPPLDFAGVMDPSKFIGRSAQQVDEFVAAEIEPIRRRYPGRTETRTEIHV